MTIETYLMDPTETEEWRRLRGVLSTIYTFLKGNSGIGDTGLLFILSWTFHLLINYF